MNANELNQTNEVVNEVSNTNLEVVITIYKKDRTGHLSFNRVVDGEIKNVPAFIASSVNECVEKLFKFRPGFLSKAKPICYELRVANQIIFSPAMRVTDGTGIFAEIGDQMTAKMAKKSLSIKEQIYNDMVILLDMVSGAELENVESI